MTDCCLRFNILGDCDFGLYEFSKITTLDIKELKNDNKEEINKALKNNIETMNIQIGDIIENEKSQTKIVCVNVKPI